MSNQLVHQLRPMADTIARQFRVRPFRAAPSGMDVGDPDTIQSPHRLMAGQIRECPSCAKADLSRRMRAASRTISWIMSAAGWM